MMSEAVSAAMVSAMSQAQERRTERESEQQVERARQEPELGRPAQEGHGPGEGLLHERAERAVAVEPGLERTAGTIAPSRVFLEGLQARIRRALPRVRRRRIEGHPPDVPEGNLDPRVRVALSYDPAARAVVPLVCEEPGRNARWNAARTQHHHGGAREVGAVAAAPAQELEQGLGPTELELLQLVLEVGAQALHDGAHDLVVVLRTERPLRREPLDLRQGRRARRQREVASVHAARPAQLQEDRRGGVPVQHLQVVLEPLGQARRGVEHLVGVVRDARQADRGQRLGREEQRPLLLRRQVQATSLDVVAPRAAARVSWRHAHPAVDGAVVSVLEGRWNASVAEPHRLRGERVEHHVAQVHGAARGRAGAGGQAQDHRVAERHR